MSFYFPSLLLNSNQTHCNNPLSLLMHNNNLEDNKTLLCSFSLESFPPEAVCPLDLHCCVWSLDLLHKCQPGVSFPSHGSEPLCPEAFAFHFSGFLPCSDGVIMTLDKGFRGKTFFVKHMSNKILFIKWQWSYLYNFGLQFHSKLWRHFSFISNFNVTLQNTIPYCLFIISMNTD